MYYEGQRSLALKFYFTVLFPFRREGQVKLEYMPPPKELERALSVRFIMTMASSPPNKQHVKIFFYAQHVRSVCVCVCVCVCIVLESLDS